MYQYIAIAGLFIFACAFFGSGTSHVVANWMSSDKEEHKAAVNVITQKIEQGNSVGTIVLVVIVTVIVLFLLIVAFKLFVKCKKNANENDGEIIHMRPFSRQNPVMTNETTSRNP